MAMLLLQANTCLNNAVKHVINVHHNQTWFGFSSSCVWVWWFDKTRSMQCLGTGTPKTNHRRYACHVARLRVKTLTSINACDIPSKTPLTECWSTWQQFHDRYKEHWLCWQYIWVTERQFTIYACRCFQMCQVVYFSGGNVVYEVILLTCCQITNDWSLSFLCKLKSVTEFHSYSWK